MLRVLFYVGILALVCSQESTSTSSDEHSGIWTVQLRLKSIGQVTYEGGEVLLFSSQETPTNVFFTPILRVDPFSSECHENMFNGHVELSLAVELHTPELIQAIRSHLKQRLPTLCSENHTCDVSLLPIRTIRLVHKTNRINPIRQLHTVYGEWYPNPAVLSSIKFPISTANESACEQLLSSIVNRCQLSNFEVQYSLQSAKTVEQSIDITADQIQSTAVFNRIRSHLPNLDVVALSNADFEQLINDVIERILTKMRAQEGMDSSLQDPLALSQSLKQQLQYKQIRLENVNDLLWNSLYWTHDATRPDRLATAMNKIICQSATNGDHFLYNNQTVKNAYDLGLTQHDIDRLEELTKQLTSNSHQRSFSRCIQEHSQAEGGLSDLGSLASAVDAHVISENHSQSQQSETNDKVSDSPHEHDTNPDPWIEIDTNAELNNNIRYALSRVEVDKYLKEFSEHVYRDGNIIRPKPINVHLIELSALRTGTKLLSHKALLRIQNNVDRLPLRCSSTNRTKDWTTNHTLRLENENKELTSTVERLTSGSSQCRRQHKELEDKVEQLTNQSSQCNQEFKKCQDSNSEQVLILHNGDKYEGRLSEGKMHGRGTIYYTNGDKYVGDWVHGNRTGQGTMIWTNGTKYVGDWVNDNMTGSGVFTWPDGSIYEGQFKEGNYHGIGTFYFSNGNKYVGGWVDDKMTGSGVFTVLDGGQYEGQYKEGKMNGRGTFYFSNGSKYVGDWLDDSMTGSGVLTWADGNKYEGQFKDDKIHGIGTYHYSDGTKKAGRWVDDSFVGHR